MLERFTQTLRRLFGVDRPPRSTAAPSPPPQRVGSAAVHASAAPSPIARSDGIRISSSRLRKSIEADEAAHQFVKWVLMRGLDFGPWAVDEIWHLAETDFAPSHDYQLPPRDKFLRELKRVPAVRFQHDKRIRRGPRKWIKTTAYTFVRAASTETGRAHSDAA